jgi:hypothetical protein
MARRVGHRRGGVVHRIDLRLAGELAIQRGHRQARNAEAAAAAAAVESAGQPAGVWLRFIA